MTDFGSGLFGSGNFGSPSAWVPGDPWPSTTAGGAHSPYWGGYVKVWIRAALAAGNTFHLGAHTFDKLDSGNVLGGAPATVGRATEPIERLWVDLSCDVLECEIAGGASAAAGILSRPDTATLHVKLADPDGKYDPLSNSSPYAYMGRSRLTPGVPVEAFCEVVDGDTGTYTTHRLFTGTADSWGEDWTPQRNKRVCDLVASDETKRWVKYNYPEQSPVGAGDTTKQRVERLAAFYGWPGTIEPADESSVTLQATTFAVSGWELLGRTLDDELGYVYFTPEGNLRWLQRAAWATITPPVLTIGCDLEPGPPIVIPPETSWGPPQKITTSGSGANAHDSNSNHGIRLQFLSAGRITKIRYSRRSVTYGPPRLEVWDSAGVRLVSHTLPGSLPDGFYEETLATPLTVAAGAVLTFSLATAGDGAISLPKPTVTETADVKFVGYYAGTPNSAWPNTPEPTFGSNIEPTFEALVTTSGGTTPGSPAVDARDVLIDASPSVLDTEMMNRVSAARTGGTTQTVSSDSSIAQYGEYGYSRTDLGVQTDVQAGEWAADLLVGSAFPQVRLDNVTIRPAIDRRNWEIYNPAFALKYVSDLVRIAWAPPDRPEDKIDGLSRVVGHRHQIDRRSWEIDWTLTAAQPLRFQGIIFTMGPHAQDKLDSGFVLALA